MCSYNHIEPVIPVSHSGVEKNNDDGKRHYFSSNRRVMLQQRLCEQMRGWMEILRTDWQREETL